MKGKNLTERPWPIPEKKLPKKVSKPAAKGAPKTVALPPAPGGKSPVEINKTTLIGAAVALAVFITVLIFWFGSRPSGPPPGAPGGGPTGTPAVEATAPATGQAASTGQAIYGGTSKTVPAPKPEQTGPILAAVRITPSQPLATDTIKAEATLSGREDNTGVTFSYQWKLNDRLLPRATADILKDTPLKRRDRISVVVTAFLDGVTGPPAESQTVVIYSLPPSLAMKLISTQVRPGQPAEIQLTGAAPDGDKLVFSLISPYVDGMTIDGNTGKILWTPQRVLQGKLPFGAAVTDTDGNKTMKVFELDLGIAKAP